MDSKLLFFFLFFPQQTRSSYWPVLGGKWVDPSKAFAQMQHFTETRLMFDSFLIKLLEDFDRLTTASVSKQSKAHVQDVCTVFTLMCIVFMVCDSFTLELVLKFWRRPPKSNKHQGCPLGSWPEAPVCSWEWRQTLADPSAIWDKENTNKAWL